MRLDGTNSFVSRDGSLPPSPRMVKEPVAAHRNLSLISSPDCLTQEIRGNRGHAQMRPGSQKDGRLFYCRKGAASETRDQGWAIASTIFVPDRIPVKMPTAKIKETTACTFP